MSFVERPMHRWFNEEYHVNYEYLKIMGEAFTSVITKKNMNQSTKLIFNFILKGLKYMENNF